MQHPLFLIASNFIQSIGRSKRALQNLWSAYEQVIKSILDKSIIPYYPNLGYSVVTLGRRSGSYPKTLRHRHLPHYFRIQNAAILTLTEDATSLGVVKFILSKFKVTKFPYFYVHTKNAN